LTSSGIVRQTEVKQFVCNGGRILARVQAHSHKVTLCAMFNQNIDVKNRSLKTKESENEANKSDNESICDKNVESKENNRN